MRRRATNVSSSRIIRKFYHSLTVTTILFLKLWIKYIVNLSRLSDLTIPLVVLLHHTTLKGPARRTIVCIQRTASALGSPNQPAKPTACNLLLSTSLFLLSPHFRHHHHTNIINNNCDICPRKYKYFS